jgi:glutathione S-transferase
MALFSVCYLNGAIPVASRPCVKHFFQIYTSLRFKRAALRAFKAMTDIADQQKTYHKKATGNALATVRRHAKDHELKLFGSCFW